MMGKKKKGFTLVELLCTMGILVVVFLTIFSAFNWATNSFSSGNKEIDNQNYLRVIITELTNAVRQANNCANSSDSHDLAGFTFALNCNNYYYDKTSGSKLPYADLGDVLNSINSRTNDKPLISVQDKGGDCFVYINTRVGSDYELHRIVLRYKVTGFVPVIDTVTGKYVCYSALGRDMLEDNTSTTSSTYTTNIEYLKNNNNIMSIETGISSENNSYLFYSSSYDYNGSAPSLAGEEGKINYSNVSMKTINESNLEVVDNSFSYYTGIPSTADFPGIGGLSKLYKDQGTGKYYTLLKGNNSGMYYILQIQPIKKYFIASEDIVEKNVNGKEGITITTDASTNENQKVMTISAEVVKAGVIKKEITDMKITDHNNGAGD